ncbi:MAG: hypothetical protein ACFFBH_02270 [Promethearchaeota archaeon]
MKKIYKYNIIIFEYIIKFDQKGAKFNYEFLNFNNKRAKGVLLLTLLLLVNFYTFVFVLDELNPNKSKLINETNELNDLEDNLKSNGVSSLFDGMYIQHNFTEYPSISDSNITYSEISADIFNVSWSFNGIYNIKTSNQ